MFTRSVAGCCSSAVLKIRSFPLSSDAGHHVTVINYILGVVVVVVVVVVRKSMSTSVEKVLFFWKRRECRSRLYSFRLAHAQARVSGSGMSNESLRMRVCSTAALSISNRRRDVVKYFVSAPVWGGGGGWEPPSSLPSREGGGAGNLHRAESPDGSLP